jgi:HAD superfamily hydrolase (TIGR01490 family)
MRAAAFFDMDETLLLVNTATRYVRWQVRHGEAPPRELLRVAGWMTQYSLGVLDAEALAAKVTAPYAGVSERSLRERVARWVREEVLSELSSQARQALERHRAEGAVCVLLTSATPYAAEPVARAVGIEHVLCSRLEVSDGVLTGRHVAPVCYGQGKVQAAERFAREHGVDLSRSWFYTDSVSDLPMLERVGGPVAVNPDARLLFEARRRGWPVERWRE